MPLRALLALLQCLRGDSGMVPTRSASDSSDGATASASAVAPTSAHAAPRERAPTHTQTVRDSPCLPCAVESPFRSLPPFLLSPAERALRSGDTAVGTPEREAGRGRCGGDVRGSRGRVPGRGSAGREEVCEEPGAGTVRVRGNRV